MMLLFFPPTQTEESDADPNEEYLGYQTDRKVNWRCAMGPASDQPRNNYSREQKHADERANKIAFAASLKYLAVQQCRECSSTGDDDNRFEEEPKWRWLFHCVIGV